MVMKTLDLGCGRRKLDGSIGIDIIKYSCVDIVHDLNKFPYPLKDREIDIINCDDILEHLEDITSVMKELHRILKDNGQIVIVAPHFSNLWSFSDPTHKHFFGYKSFEFYSGLQDNYLDIFKIKSRKITFGKFFKLFELFFNRFPELYERRFTFIVQASQIQVTLQKK